MPVANHDEDEVERLLLDRHTVVGLSDAGAHASQLCDACATTYLLRRWVREKKSLGLERAVRMITSRPAEVFGIAERGRLAPGLAADVVVFDPDTVGDGPLRRVYDFPGEADRLISEAEGIEAVIVNGTLIRRGGAGRTGWTPRVRSRGGCSATAGPRRGEARPPAAVPRPPRPIEPRRGEQHMAGYGYIIGQVEVQDPEAYREYIARAPATIARYGGEYLVRGGEFEVLEGEWPRERTVVLRFPSVEDAKRWYASPEYEEPKALRNRVALTNMVVIEGAA